MQVTFEDFKNVDAVYDPSKNMTSPIATKYEVAKIIGNRLEQIARGAPPLIVTKAGMTVRQIVLEELKQKKTPIMVVRKLPNGAKETYRLSDMIILDST